MASGADVQEKLKKGYYSVKERAGKSEVWKKFVSIIDEDGKELPFVACKECMQVLAYTTKIGNSHLNRYVCFIYLSFEKFIFACLINQYSVAYMY